MKKTLLTNAASMGLMALSTLSHGEPQSCAFHGVNTADHAVVFSVVDDQGNLSHSQPVLPGKSARMGIPRGQSLIIGATPISHYDHLLNPKGDYHYAGLYAYKGDVFVANQQIAAVFPTDFVI